MAAAIEVCDVWKQFIIRHNRTDSLKERFVGLFNRRYRERCEPFWALRGISFTVERGEALGLIGPNGSGKSTLLRLIARTLSPTQGKILVQGRVAPMIEIGVGFHHELTGQENIYLNASLYGLTRCEVDRIYEDILEFSELGEFIDVPVKNYSTGMYARLGFSIAVHLDPDILLIDEVLAVGDERFQKKCMERMMDFRRRGKTILFVSHNAEAVKRLCDRACLLMHGALIDVDEVSRILELYRAEVTA
ncbi:ABC transporter ATP-binding protein [Candidatus Acetothermia bacterium]|jgi:ABC-2 type transport system ATP-binding protein/lipopolysaccharide transport system ATP-binding protein|nr:ABC transporter ATP-binding protein [Candidatus Acetothermia bacterium]